MWLYVFCVYLPYIFYMFKNHNIFRLPISLIGWHTGGLHYLFIYIILTLPFCLYLVFFLNRHFIGNNKFISIMSVVSSILITIGAFIPLNGSAASDFSLYAHTIVSVSATIILMLTVLSAFVLHALRQKHKVIILSLYGLYAAALLKGFYIFYTAAVFQLMSSLSFFLILVFINTTAIKTTPLESGKT